MTDGRTVGNVELLTTASTRPPGGGGPGRAALITVGLAAVALAVTMRAAPDTTPDPDPGPTTVAITTPAETTGESATVGSTTPQTFRELLRQTMVQTCERERSTADPRFEAFYEYDRCLLAIDDELVEVCPLAVRAQFYEIDQQTIAEICAA